MLKKGKHIFFFISVFLLSFLVPSFSDELPIPTYMNSLIVSIEHNICDTSEVDYIKNN